jgi:inorganic pyrophosphatase
MNNQAFWQAIDKLIAESAIIIDRPKSSKHPRFDIVYPLDYGYLENTTSPDGGGIDVWRGSNSEQICDTIICTVDLLKKDSEIKLLLGCSENEKDTVLRWHNDSEMQKGVIIRREGEKSTELSFTEMQTMQRRLQERYKDKWAPLSPETGRSSLLWLYGELGEVADIIKQNGDTAIMGNGEVREHFTEELSDVMMCFNDLMLCYGISPEELARQYRSKHERNMSRWEI